MTDDKGADEGPFAKVGNISSVYAGGRFICTFPAVEDAEYTVNELNESVAKKIAESYAAGRKAERERCAKIAEKEVVLDIASLESGEFYSNSAGRIIAEKIRGGQDEK